MILRIAVALQVFFYCVFFSIVSFGSDSKAVPDPFINPAGILSAYDSVSYMADNISEFQIPEGDALRTVQLRGETWYLRINQSDDVEKFRGQLKACVQSMGGKMEYSDPLLTIFSVQENESAVWWCKALTEYGMELTIVKEIRLSPNKPMTFRMGDGGVLDVRFYAENPGGKFRSITVTVPDGEITLEVELLSVSGRYKRGLVHKYYLSSIKSNRFVIDDIPQEAGKCLFSLFKNPGQPLSDITVEPMEYDYPVPRVAMGAELGAIRIKNIPYGSAKVITTTPFGTVYCEHPEFPGGAGFEQGDVTPEGDAFFLLPPGLWQVEVAPRAEQKASALRALHIPVHAGQETLLEWPLAMTSVFGEEGDAGLRINRVKRSGNTVEVTFTLIGQDAGDIQPGPENIIIREGGAPARLLSIERSKLPLNIVTLIDSSGSMKGQMQNALKSTREFIERLPDDAVLRVVDFDTKPRPIEGKSREAILKGIESIRANGATALNDSILLGLDMLAGADRPALIVFTDGFDANHNDTGPGSKATKQEVLDRIAKAGIPVFTIGFGKGHDQNTLNRISSLSGGRYYPADDANALACAFNVINDTLSNTFTAQYDRPDKSRPSDIPVITWMVDISGSMDTTPDMSGCDYRIDKVKNVLHDFIVTLPDDVLGQVMSFEDDIYVNQVTTANKGELLSGVSKLFAGGVTNILGAVDSALNVQAAIPSSKRYLMFITDAALDVDEEKRGRFETLLGRLKDENIYCLWVGIGALDDKPFKRAAELSGGSYVITDDPEMLQQAFAGIAADIKAVDKKTDEVETLVELTLSHRLPSGRNLTFANAVQTLMPAQEAGTGIRVPACISYEVKPLITRYSPKIADLVTGDAMPIRDARISKRIPIHINGRNQAAEFTATEALFMNRLQGVDAPSGKRFLALVVAMKNVLPEQEVTIYPDGTSHPATWVGSDAATKGRVVKMIPSYIIPDLKRHLFLRWNSQQMVPLSPATWLTQAPLIMPGENAVEIPPEGVVEGTLVFMVPEEAMEQMSLHFYDMNYGHMNLPLVGSIPDEADRISSLPAKAPSQLSESFSLALREVRDVQQIGSHSAGENAVFRIVEADFVSNVQALLEIDPASRFSLRLNTMEGSLSVRPHDITSLIPLGFMAPTMLSPGSNNRIRLVFRIPSDIVGEAGLGELVVDVKGGGVVIPLDKQAQDASKPNSPKGAFKGDGIDLVVNRIARYPDSEDMFVADLTLFDHKDGQSTSMSGAFILHKKDGTGSSPVTDPHLGPDLSRSKGLMSFATGNAIIPAGTMPPDSITDELIFGITDDTVVADGCSLRGLVVFKLPFGDSKPKAWILTSPLVPDLKKNLEDKIYVNKRLLGQRIHIEQETNEGYMADLNAAVARIKRQRETANFQRPGAYQSKRKRFDNGESPAEAVPFPDFVRIGDMDFKDIQDTKTLKVRLDKTAFLPSSQMGWAHQFSPEAVMTQGWGTEGDFARMAEIVLARQGISATRTEVQLTDKGRDALAARSGFRDVNLDKLPALAYQDQKGLKYVLVFPFMETIPRLGGLVKAIDPYDIPLDSAGAVITVSLLAKPVLDGRARAARDLSDSLSGETDTEEIKSIYLLTANLSLPDLSRGAADIGYTIVGYQKGPVIKALFDGPCGRIIGSEIIDTGEYLIVGERVEIFMRGKTTVMENWLEENESIVDRFHTLGINLPDIGSRGIETLEAAMEQAHRSTDSPDNLSALKWYTRHVLYKFVSSQSQYENEMAARLDLITGRVDTPRCIVVTVRRTGQDPSMVTTIDLIHTANQIHPGTLKARLARRRPASGPEDPARNAFNLMSGIFASKLEESVLSQQGVGFFSLLGQYPPETEFQWLTPANRYAMYDAMRELKYPESMIRILENSPSVVLFPSKPAVIGGKPYWAWLEVNPETYQSITRLHTGEHGAMVERVFNDLWKDGLDFIVGGLVGVSSSIWSVSAFSLKLDDYNEIIAAAKKFALGIADNFGAKVTVGDFEFTAKPGDTKPSATYKGTGSGAVKNAKGLYDMVQNPEIKLGGFEEGFKAGVEFYFSQAGK